MQTAAHAQPPGDLRAQFKSWQKFSPTVIDERPDVLDTASLCKSERVIQHVVNDVRLAGIRDALSMFLKTDEEMIAGTDATYFEVKVLPGLFLFPSLLPNEVQAMLLDKLLHRDLSNPAHNTNLHLHYTLPFGDKFQIGSGSADDKGGSIFLLDKNLNVQPKDSAIHKPISMKQVLDKKLRWMTLGGQYDWTNKNYPEEDPPDFPADIAGLLHGLFPDTEAQAAILNFYSPGDNLSLHRDVSEECEHGLISLSIGCDALFMVSNADGSAVVTLRLRSGDAVLMSGESRFAWHAVPKVLPNTCPAPLRDWPALSDESPYDQWRGWLASKRINLNVRQMKTTSRHA